MASELTKPTIPVPFGNSESPEDIPSTADGAGSDDMSWQNGFPSNFALPISSGGKYVTRDEMNSILYSFSKFMYYLQNGGVMKFDATVASAIGGYPPNAILLYDIGNNRYKLIRNASGGPTITAPSESTIDVVNGVWATVEPFFDMSKDAIFDALTSSGSGYGFNRVIGIGSNACVAISAQNGTNGALSGSAAVGVAKNSVPWGDWHYNDIAFMKAGDTSSSDTNSGGMGILVPSLTSHKVPLVKRRNDSNVRRMPLSVNGRYGDTYGNVYIPSTILFGDGSWTTITLNTSVNGVFAQAYTVNSENTDDRGVEVFISYFSGYDSAIKICFANAGGDNPTYPASPTNGDFSVGSTSSWTYSRDWIPICEFPVQQASSNSSSFSGTFKRASRLLFMLRKWSGDVIISIHYRGGTLTPYASPTT